MNKALEILEKHCQWIAIGIGGLFLLWVLYDYVLLTPVVVPAGEVKLTPGNVDQIVKTRYADPLKQQIDSTEVVAVPKQANNVVEPWERTLRGTDLPQFALRTDWSGGSPGKIVEDDDGPVITNADAVDKLPVLPPADPIDLKSFRPYINPNPVMANGQPVPPAPPPAAPGQPPVAPQPGVVAVAGKDITCVKIDYALPLNKIAAAFTAAKIGNGVDYTSVAAIKVLRREKNPDGTWSKPVEIKRIANGEEILPLPADPTQSDANNLLNWIEGPFANVALLRPAFFQVFLGEGPFDPPAVLPVEEAETAKKAAAGQAAADRIAAEAQRKADAAQRRPTAPGRGGGGIPGEPGGAPSGRGGRQFLTDDPARNNLGLRAAPADASAQQFAQIRPPARAPGEVPPFMGIPGEPGPPPGGDPGFAQPPQPGQGQPPGDPLPEPKFQPASSKASALCWTYDDTVVEGKTYEYQILYALRNPVYASNANVAKLDVAKVFSIWSKEDDAAWSKEVTVDPSTYFFLAQPNWRSDPAQANVANVANVRMEIFKWAAGKWQSAIVAAVSPGDTIGSTITAPLSFTTNSVLVDIRYDERLQRPYVMVLSPDGTIAEREPKADREDKIRQALAFLVERDKAAAGATAAAGVP